eukprot:SAG22_NODE_523_length_9482_cov_4.992548_10_plen_129_part_00
MNWRNPATTLPPLGPTATNGKQPPRPPSSKCSSSTTSGGRRTTCNMRIGSGGGDIGNRGKARNTKSAAGFTVPRLRLSRHLTGPHCGRRSGLHRARSDGPAFGAGGLARTRAARAPAGGGGKQKLGRG